jgi:hypothetical protein
MASYFSRNKTRDLKISPGLVFIPTLLSLRDLYKPEPGNIVFSSFIPPFFMVVLDTEKENSPRRSLISFPCRSTWRVETLKWLYFLQNTLLRPTSPFEVYCILYAHVIDPQTEFVVSSIYETIQIGEKMSERQTFFLLIPLLAIRNIQIHHFLWANGLVLLVGVLRMCPSTPP